ncbi:MAG: PorT family protein [Muribaculaceae bacterium]|nr:PorT family protein [Muribaculaceae bacterium]
MKKFFALAMIAIMASLPMMAQRHNYGSTSSRYDYERSHSRWIRNYYGKDMYFGLRIGPAISHVSGDGITYAGSSKTGLHLGGVVGFEVTNRAPVFFETGLSYVNKGGKGEWMGNNVTTNLSYIELPLVFKYIYYTDMGLSIHPLFGGYLAVGVDGNIKNYNTHEKTSAFGKDKELGMPRFKRFDGGLRIGCGVGFSMFYFDMTYDIGLANISHDDYDSSSNRTFYLNFGVNF